MCNQNIYECKFRESEKATKFCDISTNYLSYVLPVKQLVEISQNFVAFSEYMNFNVYVVECRLTAGQKSEVGSDLARRAVTNDLQSVCNSSPAHAGTLFDRSKLVSCSFLVHLHTQKEKHKQIRLYLNKYSLLL